MSGIDFCFADTYEEVAQMDVTKIDDQILWLLLAPADPPSPLDPFLFLFNDLQHTSTCS